MASNFRIAKGDLVVSGRAYDRVDGSAKLMQDLMLQILERIGTDPSTPTYGSTLDGGVIDGQPVDAFVGGPSTSARARGISAEVRRVLEQYQELQIQKMNLEMSLNNGKHTLSADQVLESIDSIETSLVADMIVVRVGVSTRSGLSLQMTVPVEV